MPWYASQISRPFLFTERIANAPPPPQALAASEMQTRAISDFSGDQEPFAAALARDTLRGYEEFLAAYGDSPLAVRVRAILAVRREAITWRRTVSFNTAKPIGPICAAIRRARMSPTRSVVSPSLLRPSIRLWRSCRWTMTCRRRRPTRSTI